MALAAGIRRAHPGAIIRVYPLADGGDGTLDVLSTHLDLSPVRVATDDPLGRPLSGHYLLGKTAAFVELATASGLVLLPETLRNPLNNSTYGTGLLLADALRREVDTVYLLLGGSATHDVGTGIARALGVRFLADDGKEVLPNGESLTRIAQIELPENPGWSGKRIVLLCDVTNPLIGPRGAARVYAAQKGADAAMVERLETGTRGVGLLLNKMTKGDVLHLPGGGAAGGVAAGLYALLGAELRSGFATVSELTGLEAAISRADHVITGEGKLDASSLEGKVVGEVAQLCTKYNKPYSIVVGASELPADHRWPGRLVGLHTLVKQAGSPAAAMRDAAAVLEVVGQEMLRTNF